MQAWNILMASRILRVTTLRRVKFSLSVDGSSKRHVEFLAAGSIRQLLRYLEDRLEPGLKASKIQIGYEEVSRGPGV